MGLRPWAMANPIPQSAGAVLATRRRERRGRLGHWAEPKTRAIMTKSARSQIQHDEPSYGTA